jgi:hypothetical protein
MLYVKRKITNDFKPFRVELKYLLPGSKQENSVLYLVGAKNAVDAIVLASKAFRSSSMSVSTNVTETNALHLLKIPHEFAVLERVQSSIFSHL